MGRSLSAQQFLALQEECAPADPKSEDALLVSVPKLRRASHEALLKALELDLPVQPVARAAWEAA